MYFVSSRREASLLIPEQPVPESGAPSAGSEPPLTPEILRQRIMPFLAGLRERAEASLVLPDPEPAEVPAPEAAENVPPGEAAVAEELKEEGIPAETPAPEADPAVISGVIAKGDSASELLSPYLSASSVQQLLDVTKKVHPLSRIRTGQPYTLVRTPGGDGMERFEYEIDDQKKLIVTKTGEGFAAHVEPIVYDFNLVRVSGTIRSSLFETLASTGESPILAVRIAEIFGSEINFIKDLREGDGFSLLIEKRFRGEAFKGYGRVLGATFTNQGKTYEAYRFVTEDGEAFFTISPDKNCPFIIHSANNNYTVLGTSFNLQSYARENFAVVTLHTGCLQAQARKDVIILDPLDTAIVFWIAASALSFILALFVSKKSHA